MTTKNSAQSTYQHLLEHVDVRFSEEQLQQRVKELAETVNTEFANSNKLIIIGVLKGSVLFLADLMRHITIPCQIEFVRLSSYGNSTSSSGTVKPVDLTLPKLEGEDVLIVEDIVDTGLTMKFFRKYLTSLHEIRTLKLMTLLDKPEARTENVYVDYIGFEVGNEFLIGYGLDYAGYYRNLPFIGVLKDPNLKPPE